MAPNIEATPPERPASTSSSRPALVALVFVLLFGAYARLAGLGDADFWNDELFHVFAAQSIERGDGPRLPSGETYRRGIDITRLVRVANHYVADPEAAGRAPSAILGIASLIIFAAIAWRLAGPWSAVWAALLLAIFPVAVEESRNTRFYSQQLVYGLIAMYAGWRALAPPQHDNRQGADDRWGHWGWAALTLVAFAAAARIQPTTFSVAAGWGAAAAFFAALDLRRLGRDAFRRSFPLHLVIAGAVGLVAVLLVRPGFVRNSIAVAMDVPLWAQGDYSPLAYYWMLSAAAPLILSLLPLIFLVVARRSWALSAFLLAWFAVPVALHSFVFRFQGDRYVIVAIPALLLAAAIAASEACGALFRAVSGWVEREVSAVSPQVARFVAACVVTVVVTVAVGTTPAFTKTRKVMTGELTVWSPTDWRAAREVLRQTPGADTLPWGAFNHLAARFYWQRVDFTIDKGLLDRPTGGPQTTGPRPFRVFPEGTPDWYLGVPILSTAEAVRRRFGAGRDVIIAIDSTFEPSAPGVTRKLRHGWGSGELCGGRCGTLHLHRWTLADTTNRASP